MEYITEETVNKLQETIKNKPYICNDSLENEVIKEMLDILHDDTKFQELHFLNYHYKYMVYFL